jgi:hypothetical protein
MTAQPGRDLSRVVPSALCLAAVAAAVLLAHPPAAALAQAPDSNAPAPWIYPLPDGSALTIEVPAGWEARTAAASPGQAHFSSGTTRCEVQIAITLIAGSDPPLDTPDAVRALVDTDARDYLDRAVEGHYSLRELRGPEAAGWYFALRQREPERKSAAFVHRGAVRVGPVVLRFSIETPKPDQPEVRQALKMLADTREMRAAPARAPDAAHPETAAAAPPALVSLKAAGAPASSGAPPVSAFAAAITLSPGTKGEARLVLAIRAGLRILAHEQTGQYVQGALLAVEPLDDVLAEEPIFPAGTAWRYEPDDPEVKIYEGTVVVRVPIRAKPGSEPGSRVLKGHLRYQAVEGGLFRKTAVLPFTIPVTIGRSAPEKN